MRPRERTIPLSEGLVRAVIDAVSDDLHGTETSEICERLDEPPQRLGDAFEFVKARGILLGFGGVWFHPDRYEEATARFLAALEDIHRGDPSLGAVSPGRVARHAGLEWPHKTALRVATDLIAERRLKGDPDGVRIPGFAPKLDARQELAIERVVRALDANGFSPVGGGTLAAAVHLPPGALAEVLRAGEYTDRLVPLEDGIWFTAERLNEAGETLRQAAGDNSLTTADARTALATSRRYAHAIVAHLLAVGELVAGEDGWSFR